MGLIKQTWVLTLKNLLIVLLRHPVSTTLRALVLPIVFMFFISYAKNFFVPPADFGIGSAEPVRSLADALDLSSAGRQTVAFVTNGLQGGAVQDVINQISTTVTASGKSPVVLQTDNDLLRTCRSTLRGVTPCFGAVTFHSSPTQGTGGIWNYTLHADGVLGTKIFANSNTNDVQIYIVPFQHAIDAAISNVQGATLPVPQAYLYTSETQAQRERQITRLYQGSVQSILAVAFFIGMCGVTFQATGFMATERELGMSQLIESMMPNRRRWQPQVARLVALHLAFDLIYTPAWLVMGVIVKFLVFPASNVGILIVYHLLAGLSLCSFSILFGAFFRKAQLSGITTVIISLVLAIVAQLGVGQHGSAGAVIVLSLLFPPMNYVFFIIWVAKFQQLELPANLGKSAPNSTWDFAGIVFWVFLIIQIIVFPILGASVERSLYGTASKDRKMLSEMEDSPVSVRLSGFSKHYKPNWFKRKILRRAAEKNTVRAVDNLSLEVGHGQIYGLLGANGSGKSTTLDTIAGLNTVTAGTIEIDGAGGFGLCPQKNVMWDEVTVREHVKIFNALKSTSGNATKEETAALIAACDLAIKLNARSKTLSGGQKRKLQLAMMFTGGSRVCCVDEVSSGIDPLARRKIWDILLAERGRRSIILTSHFLDESSIMDRVAILSKGVLKAEGTVAELEQNLGSGYRISVLSEDALNLATATEKSSAEVHVDYDHTIYTVPSSAHVSSLVRNLEAAGVVDYTIQGPTIEEVFLKLSDEVKDDYGTSDLFASPPSEADDVSSGRRDSASKTLEPGQEAHIQGGQLNLSTGHGSGLFTQAWILFCKRFSILQYNYLPYIAAALIPIIAGGLVTRFLVNFNQLSCEPAQQVSQSEIDSITSLVTPNVVYGPPGSIPIDLVSRYYPRLNASSLHPVNTLTDFNEYIINNYGRVTPGGVFLGDTPTFAYRANYDVYYAVVAQNLMDSLLSNNLIATQYASFAIPFAPGAGNTLQVILYFGLAMAAYPGFFALYPTWERLRKVRALHYSNGVRSTPLWTAYVLFDFLFVLLVSVVVIILFTTLWDGWYYPGGLFAVFFLYGLTSIAYSYVISLFVPSQLAAFAFSAGSQAILFLCYFIAYLSILTYSPVSNIDNNLTLAHFLIGLITPAGNLARALLLTLNEFSVLCQDGDNIAPFQGAIKVYGGPILYLIVQFFLLMLFLIWFDSGGRITFFRRSHAAPPSSNDAEFASTELSAELARIATGADDGLSVQHLTKSFGSNLAVDNVSFGIRRGETFALLGPNGAGKSTTISLVRGDLRLPSNNGSDVLVEGVSVARHRLAARNHLGVCPQFDAMDQMSVEGHLRLYARVRGVPDVAGNVAAVMAAVGVAPYRRRLAAKLSGGNRRKLSLAIAIMGNPAVLLLDEPSSGMDAAAKRVLWRALASVGAGRALLLTTHSMEEAQACCQRAGIMAGRMLALGSTAQLRRDWGAAHYVHLVHRDAPHTPAAEMERVRAWVRDNVPEARIEERTYHGQLRFSVPSIATVDGSNARGSAGSADKGMGALFALLEAHREQLAFAYYSVSPATLDQVFLNVVNKHNVAEENYATEHAGSGGGKKGGAAAASKGKGKGLWARTAGRWV